MKLHLFPFIFSSQGSTKELSAATLEKRQRRKQERERKKRKRKELRAKEKAAKTEKKEEPAEAPPEVPCKEPQASGLMFNKVEAAWAERLCLTLHLADGVGACWRSPSQGTKAMSLVCVTGEICVSPH